MFLIGLASVVSMMAEGSWYRGGLLITDQCPASKCEVKNNTAFTVIKNLFQTFRTIFSSSSVWDITDDELHIVRNVWNIFLITCFYMGPSIKDVRS